MRAMIIVLALAAALPAAADTPECVPITFERVDSSVHIVGDFSTVPVKVATVGQFLWVTPEVDGFESDDVQQSIDISAPEVSGAMVCADGTVTLTYIMEDDPAWDCETMGNGICGTTTTTTVPQETELILSGSPMVR